jgi:hypothetical protein
MDSFVITHSLVRLNFGNIFNRTLRQPVDSRSHSSFNDMLAMVLQILKEGSIMDRICNLFYQVNNLVSGSILALVTIVTSRLVTDLGNIR